MKKLRSILLLCLALSCAFVLFACGDDAGSDKPSHTHSYEATVFKGDCDNEGYTEYKCACGHSYKDNYTGKVHSYSDEITTQPGCETEGVRTYTCIFCFDSYTEPVDAKGHDYTMSQTISVLTCTQNGVTKKKCACGHETTITVEAKGHEYITTTTSPTCTEDGLTVTDCKNCVLAHSEEIIPAKHNVSDSGICSVCNKSIWDGVTDTSWYSESAKSFTITTPEQLAGLAKLVNEGNDFSGKTVNLGGDIYLGDREWTPIGTLDNNFSGTFNGNGYTVSGFIFRDPAVVYAGLFGYSSGTIKKLNVTDCRVKVDSKLYGTGKVNQFHFGAIVGGNIGTVTECSAKADIKVNFTGGSYVDAWVDLGVVIGYNLANGVVTKCNAEGTIYYNSTYIESLQLEVGGLLGYAAQGGVVSGCASNVDVTVSNTIASDTASSLYVGGFVGCNHGDVINCSSVGSVSSPHTVHKTNGYDIYVGGFAGYNNETASMTLCSTTCNVDIKISTSSDNNYPCAGGFIGYTKGNITQCYATGKVDLDCGDESHAVAGGFAGKIEAAVVDQCYATGEVNNVSIDEAITGGFAGYATYMATVQDCYSTGKVYQKTNGYSSYSSSYAGGFIGILLGTVNNCYATGNTMALGNGSYTVKAGNLIGLISQGSSVNACFAQGDVYVKGSTASSDRNTAGALFGQYESITVTKSYYNSNCDLTSNSNSTSKYGNGLSAGNFMTLAFQSKTLGWSDQIWNMGDDILPTLKF
ncbi:MAG: hypothetical protein IJE25_02245 [Clostridia bacterium]|nr:hypothetical protein [Clostridia bacterium]